MSKKFKTNVTYAMVFKKLLSKGEKNIRLIITAAEGTSFAVYIAFLEAISSSIIASDKVIEDLELQIYTNQENRIVSLRVQNLEISKLSEYFKPWLNFAVALRVNVYRNGTKLSWLIVSGAAYKNNEIGKVRTDYENYAELLDRFLRCRESKNIKCTILDEKKLSSEEKVKRLEELITAGILNSNATYLNLKMTCISGTYKKTVVTKNYGKVTGEKIRAIINEVVTSQSTDFVYVSVVTTKNKLLEWAICY
ncbi:MAG: hypothetical protein Q4D02_06585 [Clostridia bacterium]|nr:hypothetical protein [Clostridia bacterium]